MATPIRHTGKYGCGKIVAWYIGERYEDIAKSSDVIYLDGTRPACCSLVPPCPHCGKSLIPMLNMTRCFDEDVDPGFDIEERK